MRTIITLAAAVIALSSAHAQDFGNITCKVSVPTRKRFTGPSLAPERTRSQQHPLFDNFRGRSLSWKIESW